MLSTVKKGGAILKQLLFLIFAVAASAPTASSDASAQVRGATYLTENGAEFQLVVNDVTFDCNEGIDRGFSDCDIEIDYLIESNYNGNDDPNVYLECEVEVSGIDSTGFPVTESEDESDSIYGRSGSGNIDINVSFTSIDPVIHARLTGVECRITSVY